MLANCHRECGMRRLKNNVRLFSYKIKRCPECQRTLRGCWQGVATECRQTGETCIIIDSMCAAGQKKDGHPKGSLVSSSDWNEIESDGMSPRKQRIVKMHIRSRKRGDVANDVYTSCEGRGRAGGEVVGGNSDL